VDAFVRRWAAAPSRRRYTSTGSCVEADERADDTPRRLSISLTRISLESAAYRAELKVRIHFAPAVSHANDRFLGLLWVAAEMPYSAAAR
jgi:hypothetical protein